MKRTILVLVAIGLSTLGALGQERSPLVERLAIEQETERMMEAWLHESHGDPEVAAYYRAWQAERARREAQAELMEELRTLEQQIRNLER